MHLGMDEPRIRAPELASPRLWTSAGASSDMSNILYLAQVMDLGRGQLGLE